MPGMFWDWQNIAVALIITGALAYVGRRGLSRFNSFRAKNKSGVSASSCASGCGSCGTGSTPAQTARPQQVLVQINANGARGRQSKL